jgi:DNA-binding NtrC family response regulator
MEKQDRRELASVAAGDLPVARHALILTPTSTPCAVNRCGSLIGLLRDECAFACVHECSGRFLPGSVPFAPDVVFVRLARGLAAQEIIASCKKAWSSASIVALICPATERLTEEFSGLLQRVDDFLSCPFPESELLIRLRRIFGAPNRGFSLLDNVGLKEALRRMSIVGKSPSFMKLIEKLSRLADCRETVLVSGETGSGKEVFSRAIHYQSARHGKPFVPVNCGALPDHLFENELFGHVKGAYTDASTAEKGLIAEAEGGTLFLDEVDALTPAGQIKLLRFLQDGEYRPVGSARSLIADVRVIAATNSDLMKRVRAKLFREDLYYRLNFLSLAIPPLRERLEDLLPIAAHFLERYAGPEGQEKRALSDAALQKLLAYSWPGNVRELESVITRAVTFTGAAILDADDIELPAQADEAIPRSRSLQDAKAKTLQAFERGFLASLLITHGGNVTHAAKAAGKERRAFQRLLRKHGLSRDAFK